MHPCEGHISQKRRSALAHTDTVCVRKPKTGSACSCAGVERDGRASQCSSLGMRHSLTHEELQMRPEKSTSSRFFTIRRISVAAQARTRFSCVISKKIAHKAVDRNRAKRRVRSAFPLDAARGLYVIQIKKPALTASFSEMRVDIQALLQSLAR